MEEIKLFPRINKANFQINFQLKKSTLPREIKDNLCNLKSIKLNTNNFEFERRIK